MPTTEEMNGLLNSELPEAAAFPERDRAIFELLYGCGLRNSELVGIELNDIEETNGVILVRGKGKKQRYVPLEGAAHEALQAYRPARHKVLLEKKRGVKKTVHQPSRRAAYHPQRGSNRETDCCGQGASAGHSSSYLETCFWHSHAD